MDKKLLVAFTQLLATIPLDTLLHLLLVEEMPYLFENGKFFAFADELPQYLNSASALIA